MKEFPTAEQVKELIPQYVNWLRDVQGFTKEGIRRYVSALHRLSIVTPFDAAHVKGSIHRGDRYLRLAWSMRSGFLTFLGWFNGEGSRSLVSKQHAKECCSAAFQDSIIELEGQTQPTGLLLHTGDTAKKELARWVTAFLTLASKIGMTLSTATFINGVPDPKLLAAQFEEAFERGGNGEHKQVGENLVNLALADRYLERETHKVNPSSVDELLLRIARLEVGGSEE